MSSDSPLRSLQPIPSLVIAEKILGIIIEAGMTEKEAFAALNVANSLVPFIGISFSAELADGIHRA